MKLRYSDTTEASEKMAKQKIPRIRVDIKRKN